MAKTFASNPGTVYSVSEGEKFNADTTLVVIKCWTCGIPYAIPDSLYRSAQEFRGDTHNGWKLCCPLGHTWWYIGKTETEKLREELDRQRNRAGNLAAQRDQAEASLRRQRGVSTRFKNERDQAKKRSAAAVCPCCNRSFVQLRRHMAAKHRDYLEEHGIQAEKEANRDG